MLIRVLGPVEVEQDGEPVNVGGPQQRRLLAFLVVNRGHAVSNERIVDALWTDGEAPRGAVRSMRTYMSRLRAGLPGAAVRWTNAGYSLDLSADDEGVMVDADLFERILDDVGTSPPDVALDHYERALDLWRGNPFGEYGDEWWALPDASRLTERRWTAEEDRAATFVVLGRHERAIAALERLTTELPLRERPVRLLMQSLAVGGRNAEALRVGRMFRTRLADETGLEPSQDLVDLESALLAGGDGQAADRPLRGYTVHGPVRDGPNGPVYAATQPGTGRDVEITIIGPEIADDPRFVRSFEADARRVARLVHPHIAPLYDFWREPGNAYLVTRRLPGGTLRDSIARDGPWPAARVRKLVEEIGDAMSAAAGAGVTPLPVDVSSVHVDDRGATYLVDFEIGTGYLRGGELDPGDLSARLAGVARAALVGYDVAGRQREGPPELDERLDEVLEAAQRGESGVAGGVNPYPGLRPFDESEADAFFGRRDEVDELERRVADSPFVTVVGPSGSGKSSLVRAGLVPRLRAAGRVVVTMTPRNDASAALTASIQAIATAPELRADDGRTNVDDIIRVASTFGGLVLVIDQFEECWTRCGPSDRAAFLDTLSTLVADDAVEFKVVTTVRADLLDRPLAGPVIGPHVGSGAFVLGPMAPAALRTAIEQPAQLAGVEFADGVVDDLLAASLDEPGFLPLLQFTLTELFGRRAGPWITDADLERLGGVEGAIARRAESIYLADDDDLGDATRKLFQRLVVASDDGPDTRGRAATGELTAEMLTAAQRYVEGRLLVTDRDPATREPTVEIAHDALIEGWPRLREWIDDDRQWLLQLQHLNFAADQWDRAGRLDGELYRGARLEAAIDAVQSDQRSVPDLATEFLDASTRHRDRELTTERRRVRRLRGMVVATSILAVVAIVAGILAVVQRNEARDTGREAAIEALVGRSESLRSTQRDVAALLAIEAFRLDDNPRTRSALFGTFTRDERFLDAHLFDGEGGRAGLVMPDGETAYITDEDGRLQAYDLDTGELGEAFPAIGSGAPRTPPVVAASPAGDSLLFASVEDPRDGPSSAVVYDPLDHTARFEPVTIDDVVTAAVFLPHDRVALATGEDGRVVVIDANTGRSIVEVPGLDVPDDEILHTFEPGTSTIGAPLRRPSGLALDGEALLVGSSDGSIRVLDASTLAVRSTVAAPPQSASVLIPLDDGSIIASGRLGVSRIVLDDGSIMWTDDTQFDECVNAVLVPSRGALYCGDPFGQLDERDVDTGDIRRPLDAQNGNSGSLWVADGGNELVSFGRSRPLVSRWRLDGSGPINWTIAPGWTPAHFEPVGHRLLVETGDFAEGTYSAGLIALPDELDHETAHDLAIQPLTDMVAASWVRRDEVIGAVLGQGGAVEYARGTLSRDGRFDLRPTGVAVEDSPFLVGYWLEPGHQRASVRYEDGTRHWITTIDVDTLESGATIEVSRPTAFAADSTGTRLVISTGDGTAIYDSDTGERLGELADSNIRYAWITPTDQLLASSIGGEATLYDLGTLEPLQTFSGNRGAMLGAGCTADCELIVIASGANVVSLFDTGTGIRIGDPLPMSYGGRTLNSPFFRDDGRWLAFQVETDDGGVATQIWDLDPQRWIDAACELAGRNLTADEWDTHIGDLQPYAQTCPQF